MPCDKRTHCPRGPTKSHKWVCKARDYAVGGGVFLIWWDMSCGLKLLSTGVSYNSRSKLISYRTSCSSVSILHDYRLDDRVSIPKRGRGLFL
jgi:hypothetical protein